MLAYIMGIFLYVSISAIIIWALVIVALTVNEMIQVYRDGHKD